MKKNIAYLGGITIIAVSLLACSTKQNIVNQYGNSATNSKTNTESNTQLQNSTNENKNENKKEQIAEQNENRESSVAAEEDSVAAEKEELLYKIKELANKGMIINSSVAAGKDNIDKVNNEYGETEDRNYVSDAKGLYFAYAEQKLAFGTNKGGAIFEVRSFDDSLKNLRYSDICSYFGEPQYSSLNDIDEKIVGYKITDDYKLLFVFSKITASDNPQLDHYSCFYPQGTVNYMADDPGREW